MKMYIPHISQFKKKKSSKKVNQSSIYKSYFYEIKNLYKYMLKTYTLTIIHKKKFISNGMISFNLHTVSIAHPSAKAQAPLFTITLSVSEFEIYKQALR